MSSPQVNPWFPERGCDSGLNPGEFPVRPPDPDPPDPEFPPSFPLPLLLLPKLLHLRR